MMYPSKMLDPLATEGDTYDAKLLIRARDVYGVKLAPITVQHRPNVDPTWAESFTKLLAFNQTNYDRVLSIDSDSTILQNMDELFFLPPTPVAMPRAYWLYPEKQILTSLIMLIEPSANELTRIMSKIASAGQGFYDMEILNDLYKDSAMIIPHRPYGMLTRIFSTDHIEYYLGNNEEGFDPVAIFNEAKLVHFSDWPMRKPWLESTKESIEDRQPECVVKDGVEDCTARELWNGIYTDFRERRKKVCDVNTPRKPEGNGRRS
ncbi:hypothetical protein EsH8_X_000406 [Colletotrichum jinshuiense]